MCSKIQEIKVVKQRQRKEKCFFIEGKRKMLVYYYKRYDNYIKQID